MSEPDYEQEWQDLDEKVILAQILAELQQIRLALTATDGAQADSTPMYECDMCGAEVPEDKRQAHAESKHNAPPEMWDGMFTLVE